MSSAIETLVPHSPADLTADPWVHRVYVHNTAFGALAMTSEDMALRVGSAIPAVKSYRTTEHHLQQAVDLGAMTPDQAGAILRHTADEERHFHTIWRLFRHIGYRERDSTGVLGKFYVPLMGKNKDLNRNCFDGGYYTFPFGLEAEEEMFLDDIPFPELNRQIASGMGPQDLVVVHGVHTEGLVPERLGDGWQPDLLAAPVGPYFPAAEGKYEKIRQRMLADVLTPAEAIEIEREARKKYASEIVARLALYKSMPSSWEGANIQYVEEVLMPQLLRVVDKLLRTPSFSRDEKSFLPMDKFTAHVGPHFWVDRALPQAAERVRLDTKRGLSPSLYPQ